MPAKQPAMSPSDRPVAEVLDRATGPRRAEADELLALLGEITGERPVVWANRIIGFGEHEYRYESGHGGRAPLLAFAPGPAKHTIYLVEDFSTRWPELLTELGPHRASKACLYLTRLTAVDRGALRALLERSLAEQASGAASRHAELDELLAADRARTVDRIAALTGNVTSIVEATRYTVTDDEHDPEGATIAFERSQANALLAGATEHLAEIDGARRRIADGTYGRCTVCGAPIADERLLARPTARTCITCAGEEARPR